MKNYTTIENVESLFRTLNEVETKRTEFLIPFVEDTLRQEAKNVGKDLDQMVTNGILIKNVLISVVVDIVARVLMTSTNSEPMTQTSQSALGYSFSGTFLNPGGGLFIKKSELSRLGLRKQRYGVIDFYGNDQGNDGSSN